MFVTSDIFDLKAIRAWRNRVGPPIEWIENLVCGVVVYGPKSRSYQAGAQFMLDAATLCGLLEGMRYAGYDRPGDRRTRNIAVKSFEKLTRGELRGAVQATAVLLVGEQEASGTYTGCVFTGGEISEIRSTRGVSGPVPLPGPPWCFSADFLFPLNADPIGTARELLKLATERIDAEYGYFFVRDEACFPGGYYCGLVASLDRSALDQDDAAEIGGWSSFARERLWTEERPLLRDLFQVNLLSKRHTAKPVPALGHIDEWIRAAPDRGQLEDIGEGRLIWTLTDAEMVSVRPILNDAGLLVSCRQRIYRDLPGAAEEQAALWARYPFRPAYGR